MDTRIQDEIVRMLFDDVRTLQGIVEDVNRSVAREVPRIAKQEVEGALSELVAAGLAEAYQLPEKGPFIAVEFDPTRLDEFWFQITSKGEKFVLESIQKSPTGKP